MPRAAGVRRASGFGAKEFPDRQDPGFWRSWLGTVAPLHSEALSGTWGCSPLLPEAATAELAGPRAWALELLLQAAPGLIPGEQGCPVQREVTVAGQELLTVRACAGTAQEPKGTRGPVRSPRGAVETSGRFKASRQRAESIRAAQPGRSRLSLLLRDPAQAGPPTGPPAVLSLSQTYGGPTHSLPGPRSCLPRVLRTASHATLVRKISNTVCLVSSR